MWRLLVVLLIAALSMASAAPVFGQEPADVLTEHFTSEEIARQDAYWGRAYPLAFAGIALGVVVTGMLGLGRGARALNGWVRARWRRRWPRAFVLTLVVVATPTLAALPLFAARHQHRRAFGLATNTPGEALRDLAVGVGFEFVVALIGVLVLLAIARRLPRAWPLVAAPLLAGATVVLVLIFPLVVEPAFNTFTPADPATAARVEAVAARASVDVDEVLIADASRRTTSLNAYVSGIGATTRVVLYDTLVDELPADELDVVVAHELSHHIEGDVLVGTLAGAAGAIVLVVAAWLFLRSRRFRGWIGADGPGDPAVIPFLAFFVGIALLASTPVASAISRRMEARADRFAVQVTSDPDALIDLQVRLAVENISDLDPHPWIHWAFYTHPSTLERIAIARDAATTP